MKKCPECGASLPPEKECKDYLDQMLAWDFSDFKGVGRVHHLTVLCYYLQHPNHYSAKALEEAKHFLKDIVEKKLRIEDLYKKESTVFSSDKRDWKVEGSSEDQGNYNPKIIWSMTAEDVINQGLGSYPENVEKWAESILIDLEKENLL